MIIFLKLLSARTPSELDIQKIEYCNKKEFITQIILLFYKFVVFFYLIFFSNNPS